MYVNELGNHLEFFTEVAMIMLCHYILLVHVLGNVMKIRQFQTLRLSHAFLWT